MWLLKNGDVGCEGFFSFYSFYFALETTTTSNTLIFFTLVWILGNYCFFPLEN